MDYVAALRGRRLMIATAIVMVVALFVSAVIRMTMPHSLAHDLSSDVGAHEKGAIVTHTVLPNGDKKTVTVLPRTHTRIVTIDRGYLGGSVTITRPARKGERPTKSTGNIAHEKGAIVTHTVPPSGVKKTVTLHGFSLAISSSTKTKRSMHRSTIQLGGRTDLGFFSVLAIFVGLIVATIRSLAFASENDGHLEMTFARPVAREFVALRIVATDFLTIVATEALTILAGIAGLAMYLFPNLAISPYTVAALLAAVLIPMAWYGLLLCATASMKRGYGIVVGLAWPIALGLPGIASIQSPLPLVQGIQALSAMLMHIDPLWYLQAVSINSNESMSDLASVWNPSTDAALLSVAVLGAIYIGGAIFQWRRVEA